METLEAKKLNIITSKSRADKAINSLKGILLGINLDGEVNKQEVKELSNWVNSHNDLIKKNPFNEFMNIINSTIHDQFPTKECIEDLFWLCQKYEGDNYYFNAVTSDLQILQGLCHGILADGIINVKEVFDLHQWLEQNSHLNTYYPYDEIRSLVLSVVADKKIDEDEKIILMAYFKQFVNINDRTIRNQIERDTSGLTISAMCSSDPQIIFKNKTFCITGILKSGTRSQIEGKIKNLGGIPTKVVNMETDYLIVGDNGNPAWAFSCYGRKVEKALQLRKEGHTITLVHEFDFADLLEESK